MFAPKPQHVNIAMIRKRYDKKGYYEDLNYYSLTCSISDIAQLEFVKDVIIIISYSDDI